MDGREAATREIAAAVERADLVLDLADLGLTAVPEAVFGLDELEHLDLSGNRLTQLPDRIGELRALRSLYLNGNQLTRLPDAIGRLRELRELRLYGNRLGGLPGAIGELTALTDLQLGGNQLDALPPELARLVNLRYLYGLHDEPLMDPGYLYDNPGFWTADPQSVLQVYFASEHGFRYPR